MERLALAREVSDGVKTLRVTVCDTGIGIRAEDHAKLFRAFSRVESPDRSSFKGTGLGLHLSQKLAELLGGRISVQSEAGSGSIFTLALPEA